MSDTKLAQLSRTLHVSTVAADDALEHLLRTCVESDLDTGDFAAAMEFAEALSLYRAAQKAQADAARAFTAHIAHQEFVSVQQAADKNS